MCEGPLINQPDLESLKATWNNLAGTFAPNNPIPTAGKPDNTSPWSFSYGADQDSGVTYADLDETVREAIERLTKPKSFIRYYVKLTFSKPGNPNKEIGNVVWSYPTKVDPTRFAG